MTLIYTIDLMTYVSVLLFNKGNSSYICRTNYQIFRLITGPLALCGWETRCISHIISEYVAIRPFFSSNSKMSLFAHCLVFCLKKTKQREKMLFVPSFPNSKQVFIKIVLCLQTQSQWTSLTVIFLIFSEKKILCVTSFVHEVK